MSVRTLCLAAALAVVMAAPLAAAPRRHRSTPSSPFNARQGFLIGFSVGAGDIGPDPCDDCGVAGGAELHIGAIANSHGDLAVMLEGGGLGRNDLSHGFVVAAVQWWPDPWDRFWLRGGVGVGGAGEDRFDEHVFNDRTDAAYPTLLAATGFEVVQSGRFALEALVQGVGTHAPNRWVHSFSLSIGFNWY
jgi:hypothetical protein